MILPKRKYLFLLQQEAIKILYRYHEYLQISLHPLILFYHLSPAIVGKVVELRRKGEQMNWTDVNAKEKLTETSQVENLTRKWPTFCKTNLCDKLFELIDILECRCTSQNI